MAMGRRQRHRQQAMWLATEQLPRTAGHVFYDQVNKTLTKHGFDEFAEKACQQFYADTMGRPGLAPGIYFRMQLIGYFEGIDSERGMAWRCADSLSLREFIGVGLTGTVPDHSTVSRTRRLIDLETHGSVFSWMLGVLGENGLVDGKTVGVDGSTLEANAAMKSIVRRDTGESYTDFLEGLAKASGIETPTGEDLARMDRNRPKKGSNEEWVHPDDPDAAITKMKDGRTHLAHKVEHAVDMKTGAVLAVTVQAANHGDTTTLTETLIELGSQMETLESITDKIREDRLTELVTDKGYHSNDSVTPLCAAGVRTYMSEPKRGLRNWKNKTPAIQKGASQGRYSTARKRTGILDTIYPSPSPGGAGWRACPCLPSIRCSARTCWMPARSLARAVFRNRRTSAISGSLSSDAKIRSLVSGICTSVLP
jgi:transposase